MLAVADAVAATPRPARPADGSAGVHLVGHSMGGLIAREAVLLRTGRVLSLTLLGSGPAAIGGERAASLRQLLAVLDPHEGGMADDRDQLRAIVGRCGRTSLEPQARRRAPTSTIIEFLCERTHRTCPIGLIVMARYLLTCPDRTDELAALTRPRTADDPVLPVMVIYGENDDAWPPGRASSGWPGGCTPSAPASPARPIPPPSRRRTPPRGS